VRGAALLCVQPLPFVSSMEGQFDVTFDGGEGCDQLGLTLAYDERFASVVLDVAKGGSHRARYGGAGGPGMATAVQVQVFGDHSRMSHLHATGRRMTGTLVRERQLLIGANGWALQGCGFAHCLAQIEHCKAAGWPLLLRFVYRPDDAHTMEGHKKTLERAAWTTALVMMPMSIAAITLAKKAYERSAQAAASEGKEEQHSAELRYMSPIGGPLGRLPEPPSPF
jgi:hypothetical protein